MSRISRIKDFSTPRKANSEFEIGNRVTVKENAGTITKVYRNGDIQIKMDAGTEGVYLNHAVKAITE